LLERFLNLKDKVELGSHVKGDKVGLFLEEKM
jgi:hypothetical protein